jgi:hypothetical protein
MVAMYNIVDTSWVVALPLRDIRADVNGTLPSRLTL